MYMYMYNSGWLSFFLLVYTIYGFSQFSKIIRKSGFLLVYTIYGFSLFSKIIPKPFHHVYASRKAFSGCT